MRKIAFENQEYFIWERYTFENQEIFLEYMYNKLKENILRHDIKLCFFNLFQAVFM